MHGRHECPVVTRMVAAVEITERVFSGTGKVGEPSVVLGNPPFAVFFVGRVVVEVEEDYVGNVFSGFKTCGVGHFRYVAVLQACLAIVVSRKLVAFKGCPSLDCVGASCREVGLLSECVFVGISCFHCRGYGFCDCRIVVDFIGYLEVRRVGGPVVVNCKFYRCCAEVIAAFCRIHFHGLQVFALGCGELYVAYGHLIAPSVAFCVESYVDFTLSLMENIFV